jgi:rRNA maturation endonuclease Nob1
MIRVKWTRTCPYCKHENHAVNVFCEKCGRRIKGIITPFSSERRMPTSMR